MTEKDWEQEWLERTGEDDFEAIREKLREVVEKEATKTQAQSICEDHRSFCEAYDTIKRMFFSNRVTDSTLERVRRGDHQAEETLAEELGIIDDLKRGSE